MRLPSEKGPDPTKSMLRHPKRFHWLKIVPPRNEKGMKNLDSHLRIDYHDHSSHVTLKVWIDVFFLIETHGCHVFKRVGALVWHLSKHWLVEVLPSLIGTIFYYNKDNTVIDLIAYVHNTFVDLLIDFFLFLFFNKKVKNGKLLYIKILTMNTIHHCIKFLSSFSFHQLHT